MRAALVLSFLISSLTAQAGFLSQLFKSYDKAVVEDCKRLLGASDLLVDPERGLKELEQALTKDIPSKVRAPLLVHLGVKYLALNKYYRPKAFGMVDELLKLLAREPDALGPESERKKALASLGVVETIAKKVTSDHEYRNAPHKKDNRYYEFTNLSLIQELLGRIESGKFSQLAKSWRSSSISFELFGKQQTIRTYSYSVHNEYKSPIEPISFLADSYSPITLDNFIAVALHRYSLQKLAALGVGDLNGIIVGRYDSMEFLAPRILKSLGYKVDVSAVDQDYWVLDPKLSSEKAEAMAALDHKVIGALSLANQLGWVAFDGRAPLDTKLNWGDVLGALSQQPSGKEMGGRDTDWEAWADKDKTPPGVLDGFDVPIEVERLVKLLEAHRYGYDPQLKVWSNEPKTGRELQELLQNQLNAQKTIEGKLAFEQRLILEYLKDQTPIDGMLTEFLDNAFSEKRSPSPKEIEFLKHKTQTEVGSVSQEALWRETSAWGKPEVTKGRTLSLEGVSTSTALTLLGKSELMAKMNAWGVDRIEINQLVVLIPKKTALIVRNKKTGKSAVIDTEAKALEQVKKYLGQN